MLEAEIMADGNEIDLVKYGVLWQKVQDMDRKVDKMERQLEELLALANRSKGGLWIAHAESKAALETLLKTDPFYTAGLRQSYEILHWSKANEARMELI